MKMDRFLQLTRCITNVIFGSQIPSYHNQRSVRTNTRKHPVFLGPLFFHFTKDVTTFPQFALEIKLHVITKDIRKVGGDLEKVIWQGLKQIFPISKSLYCVGQLQQRDEKKIEKLLSKTHSNAAEKKKPISRFLTIYTGLRKVEHMKMGWLNPEIKKNF